jgi:hypothetical protein
MSASCAAAVVMGLCLAGHQQSTWHIYSGALAPGRWLLAARYSRPPRSQLLVCAGQRDRRQRLHVVRSG